MSDRVKKALAALKVAEKSLAAICYSKQYLTEEAPELQAIVDFVAGQNTLPAKRLIAAYRERFEG